MNRVLYYKWNGVFEKQICVMGVCSPYQMKRTLKMQVPYKRYAEADVYECIAQAQAVGWTLVGGWLFRCDKEWNQIETGTEVPKR